MLSKDSLALVPFLLLLFTGTVCSAMIIPFMGFFLVEGLGREPWLIGVYSAMAVGLAVSVNRQFARRIDGGKPVFPLIGFAAVSYCIATAVLSVSPALWTVMSFGVAGFGISSSSVATMFSLGGRLAERRDVDRKKFNAFMRATTSTAWMIGPAVTFLVADSLGPTMVFRLCLGASIVWLALWWVALPHDVTAEPKPVASDNAPGANRALWLAAGFVFCLSTAHSLTFTALPLFYVREVGLPGFAPGTAFSVKTFVEVIAIFSTPLLIARFGLRASLLATTVLAVVTIQVLASVQTFPQMIMGAGLEGLYYGLYASLGISYVQSFAQDRPAAATAIYWNMLMISGVMAGPVVGLIAQVFDFRAVIHLASAIALCAFVVLAIGSRFSPQK